MAPQNFYPSYSAWENDALGDRHNVLDIFSRKHGRLNLPDFKNDASAASSVRSASPVSTASVVSSVHANLSKHSEGKVYSYEEDFTAASHPSVPKTHSSHKYSKSKLVNSKMSY
jgi:hypothetical protein